MLRNVSGIGRREGGEGEGEKERGHVWLIEVNRTKVFKGVMRGKHSKREVERRRDQTCKKKSSFGVPGMTSKECGLGPDEPHDKCHDV